MPEHMLIQTAVSQCVTSSRTSEDHVRSLRRRAWSNGITLSSRTVNALHDIASTSRLEYNETAQDVVSVPSLQSLTKAQRDHIAIAQLADGWQNDVVHRIAGDDMLLSVVSKYLGYIPSKASIFFFWSFANEMSAEERVARHQTIDFHYDIDGYNFLYVSFYLVDVDRDAGAHVLIERTHRTKSLRQLLGSARLTEARVQEAYKAADVVTIEAGAGEGFFEDTSCYHKALVPKTRDRLMLQIRYQ